jgi:hypothetical protein
MQASNQSHTKHEKENYCATGKGSAQSRKYSGFKLGLGKD